MKRRFVQFAVNFDASKIRTEYLEGEECFVVPMAMMTEGVHEGSQGPLLYSAADLDRWAPAWNYKPIVVNHPPKGSACTPQYLNSSKVGVVLNTRYDNKQRAEAWLNKRKLQEKAPKIYKSVLNKQASEVSTGLHVDLSGGPGKFKGKKYKAVAKNHRPDHLALLTSGVGACSVADGGGLAVANKKKKKARLKKIVDQAVKAAIRNYRKKTNHGKAKAMSPSKAKSVVLNSKEKKMKKKDFVKGLIKNELTQFTGKDLKWLMTLNEQQLRALEPKKPEFMFATQEEMDAAIEEGVESGIAENAKKPKKKASKKVENQDDDDDTDDDDADDNADLDDDDEIARNKRLKKRKTKVSLDDFLENDVPDELRGVLNQALTAARSQHDALIKVIVANKANTFKEEALKKMDLNMLQGLAVLAQNGTEKKKGSASFFGSAVPADVSNRGDVEAPKTKLSLPVYNQDEADAFRFGKRLKKRKMAAAE